jgi:hypothetical protein
MEIYSSRRRTECNRTGLWRRGRRGRCCKSTERQSRTSFRNCKASNTKVVVRNITNHGRKNIRANGHDERRIHAQTVHAIAIHTACTSFAPQQTHLTFQNVAKCGCGWCASSTARQSRLRTANAITAVRKSTVACSTTCVQTFACVRADQIKTKTAQNASDGNERSKIYNRQTIANTHGIQDGVHANTTPDEKTCFAARARPYNDQRDGADKCDDRLGHTAVRWNAHLAEIGGRVG